MKSDLLVNEEVVSTYSVLQFMNFALDAPRLQGLPLSRLRVGKHSCLAGDTSEIYSERSR